MKSVLPIAAVLLLSLSAARSGIVLNRDFRQHRAALAEASLIPLDSALDGVDASGSRLQPDFGSDGFLKDGGALLLFVVHRENIAAEIEFWNRTIAASHDAGATNPPIQYWGICDSGSECNPYQSTARFRILGYLVPYQMHIAVNADSGHEVLLYGRSSRLKARIAVVSDPSAMSQAILSGARQM